MTINLENATILAYEAECAIKWILCTLVELVKVKKTGHYNTTKNLGNWKDYKKISHWVGIIKSECSKEDSAGTYVWADERTGSSIALLDL